MKSEPLLKGCKCIHCQQKIYQIKSSSLYWEKLILNKKITQISFNLKEKIRNFDLSYF